MADIEPVQTLLNDDVVIGCGGRCPNPTCTCGESCACGPLTGPGCDPCKEAINAKKEIDQQLKQKTLESDNDQSTTENIAHVTKTNDAESSANTSENQQQPIYVAGSKLFSEC